ncbi:hypothetical protein KFE25_004882 [Diacronema lutheri]|uniref:EF-hand domain-containing protein n=1 Tax=Diacronema lutheri TaxID=2081491 RepID=A0A8J6C9U2_DIALT|nr:hypothetical protein KFE25_004882 [Diacronema lutheri]
MQVRRGVRSAVALVALSSAAYAYGLSSPPVSTPPPAPATKRGVPGAVAAVVRFSRHVAGAIGHAGAQHINHIGARRSRERASGADKILAALDSSFGRIVLRQLFHAVDADRDGVLNRAESMDGLRRIPGLGLAPAARLEEVARRADKDGDARISINEVLTSPRELRRPLVELALAAFATTDGDAARAARTSR